MWQELRTELHPRGLEIVTVALETRGAAAASRWIEAAQPEHPSLIDQAHLLDELYGVVNVPTGIWIDESGTIVRPGDTAFPGVAKFAETRPLPADAPPRLLEAAAESRRIRIHPQRYLAALRDWVSRGPASVYALAPDEVLSRAGERTPEESCAAAHFELGQHLQRRGDGASAIPHFREAHRLHPGNWTYKRQAWSLVDPAQGPSAEYESDWLTDLKLAGAENYYPPFEP